MSIAKKQTSIDGSNSPVDQIARSIEQHQSFGWSARSAGKLDRLGLIRVDCFFLP
ncbi:hypothetical protein Hanom_Chr04g00365831 [Helianthus anomalus]